MFIRRICCHKYYVHLNHKFQTRSGMELTSTSEILPVVTDVSSVLDDSDTLSVDVFILGDVCGDCDDWTADGVSCVNAGVPETGVRPGVKCPVFVERLLCAGLFNVTGVWLLSVSFMLGV